MLPPKMGGWMRTGLSKATNPQPLGRPWLVFLNMTGHYGITVESKFKGLLRNFRTFFPSYCTENLSSGTMW